MSESHKRQSTDRREWSPIAKRSLAIAALLFLAFLLSLGAFLSLRALSHARTGGRDYLTVLTLLVEIVIVSAGFFGVAGGWLSWKASREASEMLRSAEDDREKAEKLLNKLRNLEAEAEDRIAYFNQFITLIEATHGSVRPTGFHLANELRRIGVSGNPGDAVAKEELSAFRDSVSQAVAENALVAAQTARLFLGRNLEDVSQAAMAIATGSAEAGKILDTRIALEKGRAAPDCELIQVLSELKGVSIG